MSLKAILFDFNGVIINDESIHRQLIDNILLGENLRPSAEEYKDLCLGRNDYESLPAILAKRGRVVKKDFIEKLIQQKSQAYERLIQEMESLPLYEEVIEFILNIQERNLVLAIVTGALTQEVELILTKANIRQYFSVIVGGEEVQKGKPDPESYLLALDKINLEHPNLNLKTSECLVIEDTLAGIVAGQEALMQVVGVTNTYPFHILHRQANWCVDSLLELDLEMIEQVLTQT